MARKLVLNIVFFAVAVGAGVLLSLKPWVDSKDIANRSVWQQMKIQRGKATAARADMKSAENERAELAAQRARLESPAGKEAMARERGLLKPGEVPIEVR